MYLKLIVHLFLSKQGQMLSTSTNPSKNYYFCYLSVWEKQNKKKFIDLACLIDYYGCQIVLLMPGVLVFKTFLIVDITFWMLMLQWAAFLAASLFFTINAKIYLVYLDEPILTSWTSYTERICYFGNNVLFKRWIF